jgi:hypothetical protein
MPVMISEARKSRVRLLPGLLTILLVVAGVMPIATAGTQPGTAGAGDSVPTITFRKVFKSSYPEFTEIKVMQNGECTADIRSLDDEASPQPFQISGTLAAKIFSLAARLHNFNGIDLDLHRRIANLGQKTFVYENGPEKHEVKFNYTLDETATQLEDILEGLGREELDFFDLQRTMRYDRLGVNDVLIRIDSDYSGKLLPEPDRLLPLLDQIAADDKFIDLARQKARTLAGKIRGTA